MNDLGNTTDFQRRFGGLDRLYGKPAAARLRQSHIAVVGVGGVGSWTAEALARSGVGQLTLIDLDHIAESNINRQIHALDTTLGQAKVVALRERIAAIHPACVVHAVEAFVSPENWPALLPLPVDGLVDACDQMRAKEVLVQWGLQTATPLVCVGAAGGKRAAHRVEIDDLSRCTHDPLLAALRQRLRRQGLVAGQGAWIGVDCVFSREPVAPPDASCAVEGDGSLNCHGYGSSVAVTATFGLCAAGWVLERILGNRLSKPAKNTL